MYQKFRKRVYLQGSKKSQVILGIVLLGVLLVVAVSLWFFYQSTHPEKPTTDMAIVETNQEAKTSTEIPIVEDQTKKASFDAVKLQEVLDTWSTALSGSAQASVVLADMNGEVFASLNPDQLYFTASIYKLYVAYEGYRLVDASLAQLDEQYLGTFTFGQCLDKMIRESDSPCAEKLWTQLGKEQTTEKLKEYGIKNTSLTGLTTTASDAATMLARIARGEGLSSTSQVAFMQSMKDQIYRDTLNKGFSGAVTVYNKIGFNEQLEYHDTAIIELEDGRQLIVSVLTQTVGTSRIIELAQQLEAAFN